MKKTLVLSIILGGSIMMLPPFEANAATPSPNASVQEMRTVVRQNRRWNNRRRVVTTTRIRRIGFRTYRETIRRTYLPNGRTRTVVIRRVRIR